MLGYPLPKCSTRNTSETNKPVFTDLQEVPVPLNPWEEKTNPINTNNVTIYLVLINTYCNSKNTTKVITNLILNLISKKITFLGRWRFT